MTKRGIENASGAWCWLLGAWFVLSFSGCFDSGPVFFPVKGKVISKKDGKPIQFGSLEFRSNTEPPVIARGEIKKDGSFTLSSNGKDGAVAGTYSVIILQVIGDPRHEVIVHDHGDEVLGKYTSYRTSDLKVEINEENALQLELQVDVSD